MRGNPAPSTTDHEYSLVEGGRVGYADSVSKRPDEIRRVNHGVEEAEQGTAFDEVGSAEGLHFSDGLHERLGGGPADAEKFFNVHAAPGFGPCVSGALPDGVQFSSVQFSSVQFSSVQFAGPFDGATHRKAQLSSIFRIPGLLAHLPKTLSESTRNYQRQCALSGGNMIL
jgi:hypothetical protein